MMTITEKINPETGETYSVLFEDFLELTGINKDRLQEALDLGWLESWNSADSVRMFRDADIYRVRKLERICGDFDLPVLGATIIIDLLERIELLERKLHNLQQHTEI